METLVIEKYILQAENEFENGNYLEGMGYLEEALTHEPHYGKAHNHMGWVYLFHLNDWVKAEKHLRTAIKYNPNYGPTYMHMAYMLFEQGKFSELETLLQKAVDIGGVNKTFIYTELGRMLEVKAKFGKAIGMYKKSIRWSFNDKELSEIKDHIHRCRRKRWLLAT